MQITRRWVSFNTTQTVTFSSKFQKISMRQYGNSLPLTFFVNSKCNEKIC